MATIQERALCSAELKERAGRWTVDTRTRSSEVAIYDDMGAGIRILGHAELEAIFNALARVMRKVENPDRDTID